MIFHRTHANEKVAARVLSHTTETSDGQSFVFNGNACEDTRDVCATACPACHVSVAFAF